MVEQSQFYCSFLGRFQIRQANVVLSAYWLGGDCGSGVRVPGRRRRAIPTKADALFFMVSKAVASLNHSDPKEGEILPVRTT